MKHYLLVILFLASAVITNAENPDIKFGKVDKEELLMTHYEKDSSADAVVLSDIGNLYFTYNNATAHRGFEYTFTRHLRIKIFNKNAYDYANHEIRLRHYKTSSEEIKQFKAYTFNIENKKINKTKITKSDLLIENYNENIDYAKFTMPDVQEGSIIDIEYTIQSDYLYYLRDWHFQYNIPVVYSELQVSTPEYYKYKHFFDGIQKLTVNEKGNTTQRFTIQWENQNRPGQVDWSMSNGTTTQRYSEDIQVNCNQLHFVAEDIEAFKEEPYMASTDNYLFKVYFELEQIKFPNQRLESYAKSWETVNKDLIEDRRFGERLRIPMIPNDLVPSIIEGCETDEEKAFKIFQYIQDNIRWNKELRVLAESTLRGVLKDQVGSSAEINLLLVAMLREAGINAHPVIISTRANGMVNKLQPGISQFNNTIAYALINQKNYLFDGTSDYSLPNLLPKRCLNGEGRIIGEDFTDWINLTPDFYSKEIIGGNYVIDTEHNFIGKTNITKDNYFAYDYRITIDKHENTDKYIEEYDNENHNLEISHYNIDNLDEKELPVKITQSVKVVDNIESAGNLIMFNPLNIYAELDNPFKAEERKYPVNYTYPFEQLYVMNYQIPEGYEVEELPQSVQVVTPDNSATFFYKVVSNGNIIQVTCKKNITKTFYLPSEYSILKDFYNNMISKQNEKIILKKVI